MGGGRVAAIIGAVLAGCAATVPAAPVDAGATRDATTLDDALGVPADHERTDASETCAAPRADCGGLCADTTRDPRHCGGCGRECRYDESCIDGRCALVCAAPTIECDGGCVDPRSDFRHCGACGNLCQISERCVDGRCVSRCTGATRWCGGNCVDVTTSLTDCGACHVYCEDVEVCVAGRCEVCPAGRARCGRASCGVDLQSDVRNCGACGAACAEQPFGSVRCEAGRCVTTCEPGRADCTAEPGCETDTQRGDAHCGACGRRCASDERCRTGTCVPRLPRPRRPMSGAEVLTRRPRFAWVLGDGYDGARIEVCATRACDAALRSADVTGDSHTFAEPFAPGVYFWRVRGRRGAAFDARPTVVWPLAVSATEGPLTPERVLADYDGDGRADAATTVPPRSHYTRRCPYDVPVAWAGLSAYSAGATSVGDLDGDGYGDAIIGDGGSYYDCYRSGFWGYCRTIAYGSPTGIRRSGSTTLTFGVVYDGPSWAEGSPEDYDGDGLADHLWFDWRNGDGTVRLILGSDPATLTEAQSLGDLPQFFGRDSRAIRAAGDVDGDLAAEVAWSRFAPDATYFNVWRVERGALVGVALPRCEAHGADPAAMDPRARLLSVAPDDDRDGVVDLVANATRAGSTVRVRWFGGPGAPRADRCALEAP